jgi:hypothetical protein
MIQSPPSRTKLLVRVLLANTCILLPVFIGCYFVMKNRLLMAIAIATSMCLPIASVAESRLRPAERQFANRLLLSKQPILVDFPEVGLAIPQPSGFIKATSFNGFEQADTKSSVMLSKIPGPFAAVTKGFNQSTLAARGIELISKQSVKIDNQSGLLLKVSQSAYGQKFLKWILVFGNERDTKVIVATFPIDSAPKLSDNLKAAILAVAPSKIAAPDVSSLPFTVTAVEGLTRVTKITSFGKSAAFTKDGKMPNVAVITDPLFIVTPSLGAVPVGDLKSFAQQRLSNYPQIEIEKITATTEISIDNLPGWEMTANGRDLQTKATLKIYQAILFPKSGGYILMVGIVGDKQADLYLPKFKAIALTYRNSPQ